MTDRSRLRCKVLADRVMSAEDAAALIAPGDHVGMSGFTGSAIRRPCPRRCDRVTEAPQRGNGFAVSVWTGASTAPELDGALAAVDGIELRMPYQSDPVTRAKINAGLIDYMDVHLSHVAQMVGRDSSVISTSRSSRSPASPRRSADPVLVGRQQQDVARPGRPGHPRGQLVAAPRARGHARIYYGTALPPNRKPIQILRPTDRIGCPTCSATRRRSSPSSRRTRRTATPRQAADGESQRIAGHVLDFLDHEIRRGRLPPAAAAAVRRRQRHQRRARRA